MSYLDITLGAFLVFGAVRGFMKGFISQIFGLAALFVGIFGAIKFSGWASEKLAHLFNINSETLPLISFLVVLCILVVVVLLIGKLVDGMVESTKLGILNRVCGSLFSITKIALLLSVLLWTLSFLNSNSGILPKKTVEESYLYKPIEKFAPTVIPLLRIEELSTTIKRTISTDPQDEKPSK